MSMNKIQAKRLEIEAHLLNPGEYTPATTEDGKKFYYACTPNGLLANLANHNIVENSNGTITVSPSILVKQGDDSSWHGYLEDDVWREC